MNIRQIRNVNFEGHEMENVNQYAHGAEHEVHIRCKRSLSTLILSMFVLITTGR